MVKGKKALRESKKEAWKFMTQNPKASPAEITKHIVGLRMPMGRTTAYDWLRAFEGGRTEPELDSRKASVNLRMLAAHELLRQEPYASCGDITGAVEAKGLTCSYPQARYYRDVYRKLVKAKGDNGQSPQPTVAERTITKDEAWNQLKEIVKENERLHTENENLALINLDLAKRLNVVRETVARYDERAKKEQDEALTYRLGLQQGEINPALLSR